MGQDELCKVISPKVSESPKQDSENCKIGDFQEPDYIDADIFTPIVKTGEPKVSAGKEQNPNISVIADNESHCAKLHSELFCVTGKDSGFIDIEDLY